jgi:hypothetical protein
MCDWEVGLIELSVVRVAVGVGAGGDGSVLGEGAGDARAHGVVGCGDLRYLDLLSLLVEATSCF